MGSSPWIWDSLLILSREISLSLVGDASFTLAVTLSVSESSTVKDAGTLGKPCLQSGHSAMKSWKNCPNSDVGQEGCFVWLDLSPPLSTQGSHLHLWLLQNNRIE